MNPQDQNSQSNQFSLNRNSSQDPQSNQTNQSNQQLYPPVQQNTQQPPMPSGPLGAFPANVKREFDMNIKQMVIDLVERKYCPNQYIARYEQMSAQDPQKFPPIDENTKNMIRQSGPDISPEAKEFEINRAYNKLEIEIYEMSTSYLPADKKMELQKMTEEAQSNPAMLQQYTMKMQQFMQQNVPNIKMLVDEYIRGFMNQYIAGRY